MPKVYSPKPSNEEVYQELITLLPNDTDHKLFDMKQGPSNGTNLRNRKSSTRKNVNTWEKVILNISRNVSFDGGENDCFVSTYKDSGGYSKYKRMKFGKSSKNVTVHRVVAGLKYANRIEDVESATEDTEQNQSSQRYTVSHLCGNASCFRPKHLNLETLTYNQDRNGCRYGCAALCPHNPLCIWVEDGEWIEWRNNLQLLNKH